MRIETAQQLPIPSALRFSRIVLAGALFAGSLTVVQPLAAQAPTTSASPKTQPSSAHRARSHRHLKNPEPAAVVPTPPPPPMPVWPINDKPSPASVVWDANGLRINASNSSLQQILSEVSTETGTKVEGLTSDQRVYGEYGPGKARDVLSQLLQGSGYNVLLAGDIGQGAPRELVLSPLRTGPAGSNDASNPNQNANRLQPEPDEDVPPEQPEEQPPVQVPQVQNPRQGFGPGGPIRTPQQVMEEMQQRQILQQQQMQEQQQQQQQNPPQ